MLQHFKPTDAAIEKLALAETDPRLQSKFAPLRWGFLGNLTVILFAASGGFVHAVIATVWRRATPTSRNGRR